jgi:hypothetical protein
MLHWVENGWMEFSRSTGCASSLKSRPHQHSVATILSEILRTPDSTSKYKAYNHCSRFCVFREDPARILSETDAPGDGKNTAPYVFFSGSNRFDYVFDNKRVSL